MGSRESEVRKSEEKRLSDFVYKGPAYFAEDALAQVEQQRMHGLSNGKVILASSSGIVGTLSDGRSRIITPQEMPTPDEEEQILQDIYDRGFIHYTGTLAFGRKNGIASHAVSTYVNIILKPDTHLSKLPDPDELYSLGESFIYGYIKYLQEGSTGTINAKEMLNVHENSDPKLVPAFMSGKTPELLQFAEEVCRFDEKTGPMISELVGRYPFNNMVFRSKFAKSDHADLEEFYREIIANRKQFFKEYGGDCTLFSLEVADKLSAMGLDPKILLYPSTKIVDGEVIITAKRSHNAVVVEDPDSKFSTKYYIDPGYSVPWAVPMNRWPFSVYPRSFGDGKSMITRIVKDEKPIVALMVNDQAKRHLAGEEVMDPKTCEETAPEILAETHYLKDIIKWDYQDQLGRRTLGIRYKCSQGTLTCVEAGIDKVPLQQFFEDSTLQDVLRHKCTEIGADFYKILDELRSLPRE